MQGRRPSALLRLCIASSVLCLAACLRLCAVVDVNSLPKPTGYVGDLAHVLNAEQKEQLEAFCTQVEEQLGVQFALVTIDSVEGQPIEDFAIQLARKWGVGDKKNNQGVLLLLAVKDRKSDIETGRGIEPYLTDGFSGSILRSMRPELREDDYGSALLAGARAMAQQIAQAKGAAFSDNLPQPQDQLRTRPSRHRGGIPGPLVILGIFLLLWIVGRAGRGGRGGGTGSFLTGMLLGNLLGGGRGYGGGGGWGNGGGFGGDSGGGGGFGGFGGGDFGGGGANSDW